MNRTDYTKGLVSVSFRAHSPKEILQAMKDSDLSVIEWGSDRHAPCNDTERLREIAALQEEYGIRCSSYGTYFKFFKTPIEELEGYILAAKTLGTDRLRIWCGPKSGADMTQKEREELLALCRRAEEMARAHGVILCLECHKKTFTERLEDALWLMEEIGSPHLRMYWQPFQWLSAEENLRYARAIAPYTEYLHVFNWKGEDMLPLGDAEEEWRSYLAAFSTPRTLLLEFMPDGRIESLPVETEALTRIIGGER